MNELEIDELNKVEWEGDYKINHIARMSIEKSAKADGKLSLLMFLGPNGGLDQMISGVKASAKALTFDANTKPGRAGIKSNEQAVYRAIIRIQADVRKLLPSKHLHSNKQMKDLIKASNKKISSELNSLRSEIKKPLLDWEVIETNRRRSLDQKLEGLRKLISVQRGMAPKDIEIKLDGLLELCVDDSWEEFKTQAVTSKSVAIQCIKEIHRLSLKSESDDSEIKKFKKESSELTRAGSKKEAEKILKNNEFYSGSIRSNACESISSKTGITHDEAHAVVSLIAEDKIPNIKIEY